MTEYEVRAVFRVTEESSGMEDQVAERAWAFIEQTLEPTSIDVLSVNEIPEAPSAEIIRILFPREDSGK